MPATVWEAIARSSTDSVFACSHFFQVAQFANALVLAVLYDNERVLEHVFVNGRRYVRDAPVYYDSAKDVLARVPLRAKVDVVVEWLQRLPGSYTKHCLRALDVADDDWALDVLAYAERSESRAYALELLLDDSVNATRAMQLVAIRPDLAACALRLRPKSDSLAAALVPRLAQVPRVWSPTLALAPAVAKLARACVRACPRLWLNDERVRRVYDIADDAVLAHYIAKPDAGLFRALDNVHCASALVVGALVAWILHSSERAPVASVRVSRDVITRVCAATDHLPRGSRARDRRLALLMRAGYYWHPDVVVYWTVLAAAALLTIGGVAYVAHSNTDQQCGKS